MEKDGDDVYELEALPPEQLLELVDEAVRSVIDGDLFKAELERERTNSQWLDVTRCRLIAALSEVSIDEETMKMIDRQKPSIFQKPDFGKGLRKR